MTDAISRSAALEMAYCAIKPTQDNPSVVSVVNVEDIENLPALDVEPVVHARWIEDGYRGIPCVCSHCGEEAHYKSTFVEQYGYDWNENLVLCGYSESKEYIRSKCCPECGARMDGEAHDQL